MKPFKPYLEDDIFFSTKEKLEDDIYDSDESFSKWKNNYLHSYEGEHLSDEVKEDIKNADDEDELATVLTNVHFQEIYDVIMDEIGAFEHKNSLIYRRVTLDSKDQIYTMHNVGTHWSWVKEYADPYHDIGGNTRIAVQSADKHSVDVDATLYSNLKDDAKETEIVLHKGKRLELHQLCFTPDFDEFDEYECEHSEWYFNRYNSDRNPLDPSKTWNTRKFVRS